MNKPFFTIAIPTYNRSKDLKIALEFLLQQDFKNFEIVISDNCSTDDTNYIVSLFKDKRIRYFANSKNIQVIPNIQRVIDLARGRYIFLHADDDFIVDKTALKKAKKIIDKQKLGYLRLNYLSFSPNKKYVFDFRASKHYKKNVILKSNLKPLTIIDFLLKSDCSFITGIVFRNDLSKDTRIIDSQLYSWFPIIFYMTKRYGACYVNKPYIIAGWSTWRAADNNFNSLYSLVDGELTSEKYFNFVKNILSDKDYKEFLKQQLFGVYATRFPAIKLYTGARNLLELKDRLILLSPGFKRSLFFWLFFIAALIIPKFLLTYVKHLYLFLYIQLSKRKNAMRYVNKVVSK
jgi:glycosyltransferase involved in cell wall biosynthesis